MPQRYQREIEEILKQVGNESSTGEGDTREEDQGRFSRKRVQRGFLFHLGVVRWFLSPGKLALAGLALLVAALVLRTAVPRAMGPVAWVAVSLLAIAYVLFFLRPRAPLEKRWRGRLLEEREPWSHRLRRWWSQK